jgi:hypothetical protein
MIEIRISDPYNTPAPQLLAVAMLLSEIARKMPTASAPFNPAPETETPAVTSTGMIPTISPADNPATGVDSAEIFAGGARPDEVFAGNANPAEVFANVATAGNVSSLSGVAPETTVQPATAPVAAGETDKDGLPWDARIHASSKAKNADGRWRGKRGVDDAVVTQVTAELRAVMGAVPAAEAWPFQVPGAEAGNAPAAAIPVPPAPPAVSGVTTVASTPAPVAPVPVPPVASIPAAPATAPSTTAPVVTTSPTDALPAGLITFPQLCGKITASLNSGALTQERLAQVLQGHKVQSLPTLAAFPHLVGPIATALGFA